MPEQREKMPDNLPPCLCAQHFFKFRLQTVVRH